MVFLDEVKIPVSVLAVLLWLPVVAEARPKTEAKPAAQAARNAEDLESFDRPQDITLPLAKGELQAEVEAEQTQRERANRPRTAIGLGLSTWTPKEVLIPSRLADTSAFKAVGFPAFNGDIFSPLSRHFSLNLGLQFLVMRRNGTLTAAGLASRQEEKAYVTSLRLGAEYRPWRIGNDHVQLYGRAGLLPTLVVTGKSSFDDGINDTGFPVELAAGALIDLHEKLRADVGISELIGKAGNSRLTGFAVNAGLRFPL